MITVIVHRSAGNESVGSQWHEAYHFEESATLKEVIEKVSQLSANGLGHLTEDIIIPVKKP